MSVLIKGMKMPREGCKDCPLVKRGLVFDICPFLKREVDGNVERGGKPYDCPLIELPDHGDLKDADLIIGNMQSLFDKREEETRYTGSRNVNVSWNDAVYLVTSAPVVIPAERSESDEA